MDDNNNINDLEDEDVTDLTGEGPAEAAAESRAGAGESEGAAEDYQNKYIRLYAEFENYKKRVIRDREDQLKYGNEALLYEMLPALDHLELALKHSSGDPNSGLVQGVEMTLKELQRTLEKFGLRRIEASGKCFDPAVHHAMMQVERDDLDDKMVADELRAGYLLHDKVLRPSLVSVSVRPKKNDDVPEDAACSQSDGVTHED